MGEPRADQDPWLCVLPFHHFHPQPQRPDPDIPDMLKLLDELIEQRYGDLQPQRSPAQSVHGEEPDPDHARGPAMNEDMGPANDLAKALALVHSGARASSMHERCDLDLEEDLPQMTGFDMAKLLWPHQKAAVGRMRTILEKYKAVALFFEMGLGKTLIVIGKFNDVLLCPRAEQRTLTRTQLYWSHWVLATGRAKHPHSLLYHGRYWVTGRPTWSKVSALLFGSACIVSLDPFITFSVTKQLQTTARSEARLQQPTIQ